MALKTNTMKYLIGFILAASLIANMFFISGYKKYAIRVEQEGEWRKRTWITFKSFGEPIMINSNPKNDSLVTSVAQNNFFIQLDSVQHYSIEIANNP